MTQAEDAAVEHTSGRLILPPGTAQGAVADAPKAPWDCTQDGGSLSVFQEASRPPQALDLGTLTEEHQK